MLAQIKILGAARQPRRDRREPADRENQTSRALAPPDLTPDLARLTEQSGVPTFA